MLATCLDKLGSIQSLSSKPKEPDAGNVSCPPQHTSSVASLVVHNVIIRKNVRNPDGSVCKRIPVDHGVVHPSSRSNAHCSHEERKVFNRVLMCRLQSLDPVQICSGDLALLDGCLAMRGDVVSGTDVAIDSHANLETSGRGDDVGQEEIGNDKVRSVIRNVESACQCIGARAKAEAGDEVGPALVLSERCLIVLGMATNIVAVGMRSTVIWAIKELGKG